MSSDVSTNIQCRNCVMQSQDDPDFQIDWNGVCNYCREFKKKENEYKFVFPSKLPWIIEKIRESGKGKKYDCLIGLSGGVDSSTALVTLVKNGLRPLAYQVDNGYNDPKADENVMRLVEGLKVPFFRYTIDYDKFNELYRAFIQSGTKNLEIVSDHLIMATTYEMARKYGIKIVVSGGNWQTESVMPESYGYQARDLSHIRAIYKQFTGKKLTGLPTISLPQYLWYRFVKKIEIINILDYTDYNRQRSIEMLVEQFGWKDYHRKHEESRLTKWFQNCYLLEKWALDKRRPHLSSMILSGQMTREEALAELEIKPEHESIEFGTSWLRAPKKDHKDYPNNERLWKLLSRIYAYIK